MNEIELKINEIPQHVGKGSDQSTQQIRGRQSQNLKEIKITQEGLIDAIEKIKPSLSTKQPDTKTDVYVIAEKK